MPTQIVWKFTQKKGYFTSYSVCDVQISMSWARFSCSTYWNSVYFFTKIFRPHESTLSDVPQQQRSRSVCQVKRGKIVVGLCRLSCRWPLWTTHPLRPKRKWISIHELIHESISHFPFLWPLQCIRALVSLLQPCCYIWHRCMYGDYRDSQTETDQNKREPTLNVSWRETRGPSTPPCRHARPSTCIVRPRSTVPWTTPPCTANHRQRYRYPPPIPLTLTCFNLMSERVCANVMLCGPTNARD